MVDKELIVVEEPFLVNMSEHASSGRELANLTNGLKARLTR